MELRSSIESVKGIGEKTAKLFNKLHIYTVEDLIKAYPRDYLSYEEPRSLAKAPVGIRIALYLEIKTYVNTEKRGRYIITSLTAGDSVNTIKLVWFNSPFLRNVLKRGDRYVFVGTIKKKNNFLVMEMPEYYPKDKYKGMMTTMQPVYSLTSGLTNNSFQRAIRETGSLIRNITDPLPEKVRQEYKLMRLDEALFNMHFPQNEEVLKDAVRRLAFDEFAGFLLEVRKLREENSALSNTHPLSEAALIRADAFIASLPFSLTNAQKNAICDIKNDMSSDYVMNRLVQGDVGSGKTIIAVTALYMTALSGYQGVLMVPTEVLAQQHFKDIDGMLRGQGIRTALLTGSLSVKEKRVIYEKLKAGEIDILIGTHAVIQDKVEIKNLGLVVTDEQHRFGVRQREKLSEKGQDPHVLIMSATPIPRTLAIILYADLDISVIDELPASRKRVMNCVVDTSYRDTAYKFILKEIRAGHQAYIICPMVDSSEAVDAENVIDYSEELKAYYRDNARIEYLHGKMKDEEKNQILARFMNREIDILVSTTVIEVGINNQNATVMMIENAERFGLAQLHQLRGRVGRGSDSSYCIFINAKETEDSVKRLKVLENSNDGFYIANEDMKQRGPGDFFGIRQSGDMIFKVADIYNHADILRKAQDAVLKYGDELGLVQDNETVITTL
ncbi:MAG: ATP-dependent DNA helicase RecG [Eubacterium sp.]|nr:ATP-dependent DNA helicase RecG [Eubacterium sp.]